MSITIDDNIVRKVLETVDHGLVRGLGQRVPGKMCVEAAVCYALGLDHSDDPQCVSNAVRNLKINLNDSGWSSNKKRAEGLRKLAIAQLGTDQDFNEMAFVSDLTITSVNSFLSVALRNIGFEAQAELCEQAESLEAAKSAAAAAKSAVAAAAVAVASATPEFTVVYAAAEAAEFTAKFAESGAKFAGYAVDDADVASAAITENAAARFTAGAAGAAARFAAGAAARFAAAVASAAAESAAGSAGSAAVFDDSLMLFSDHVTNLLIKHKAKGTEFLYLTEENNHGSK